MPMAHEEQSKKFSQWSQRQQLWLQSQIESAKYLKSRLQEKPLDEEMENEIRQHEKQTEQLETLTKEYDILRKEMQPDFIQSKENQKIINTLKELIQTLIDINEEIYQIVLQQKENLQKEMSQFFPLKNRFEKYYPQDKNKSNNLDYDI